MTSREQYTPGPASGAQAHKDGEKWTLILIRELRHSPEKVWQALSILRNCANGLGSTRNTPNNSVSRFRAGLPKTLNPDQKKPANPFYFSESINEQNESQGRSLFY